ncbi:MAG: hypothetical protein QOE51_3520 [Actinoplanes sp.]|jgi:hypothetical protein|nr:hypothetical protein [Actinoplanes sp.]
MTSHTSTTSATAQVCEDRTVVAHAWPTGRPIYAYTPQELADGVDLYTRLLKARRRERGERDA